MPSDTELEQLKGKLNEIQSQLLIQQNQYEMLDDSLRSLKQRLLFFEQLVFADYLLLLEQLIKKASVEKPDDHVN